MTTPTHDPDHAGEAPRWLGDSMVRIPRNYSGGVFWNDENHRHHYLTFPEIGEVRAEAKARAEAAGTDYQTELRFALLRVEEREAQAALREAEEAEDEPSAPLSSPSSRGSSEPGDAGADWIPDGRDAAVYPEQGRRAGMTSEEFSQEPEKPEDPGIPLDRASEMDLALGRPRHNQWTRRKMVLFLRELAASQSVSQAARSVGMSRQSAYKLRTRLNGTPFALGWELALEAGIQQLAHAVMDRALNGEEVPHYHRGELVGTSRRHDNHLARWVLENPWKLGRMQIAREYAADGFDKLLERIEWEPLDWQENEPLPGHTLVLPELDEDGEPLDSEAGEEEPAPLGPDGQPVPRVWTEEDRFAAAKRKDVDDFLRQRSWYVSESRRRASERPGMREAQTRARR